ncbi:MAG: nucleotidyltransferase domain-containing protein [Candidatus Paceibacter sp.]|nr:nucleotidyltransferase domain-containing protein [Candidatus Paceibacter sp.]
MLYSQRELQNILENYFKEIADTYGVEMAFLYGSWARGYPKESSDVDIAIVFSETDDEDEVFGKITDITLSLMGKIKLEINIIPVFLDFRKPILYYNAIVLGIPVFIRDQNRYAALLNEAIFQMEDFSIFGTRWQLEIAEKNLVELRHAGV